MNKKIRTVYFIVPAPLDHSPGQRFRHEHYLPYFERNNLRYRVSSFYTPAGWKKLYSKGNKLAKVLLVLRGFLKRFLDLFRLGNASFVYVYREAAPIGPPVFEWIIAKLLRKKIIYDFDDSIWVPVSSEYNKAAAKLRFFSKVGSICKWSHIVTVGNKFLAAYAGNYNSSVRIIPTVVNTDSAHNKLQDHHVVKPAVGWTGSFSTLKYLDIVVPVINELQQERDFDFIVIADRNPELPVKSFKFIKWNGRSEVADLLSFHIGLMPLYDNDESRGKCGFKAIQYMSLGIPAIVSPVGVNSEIVSNGVDGFICSQHSEWKKAIIQLLEDEEARAKMGFKARKKIEDKYSVSSTVQTFFEIFSEVK